MIGLSLWETESRQQYQHPYILPEKSENAKGDE